MEFYREVRIDAAQAEAFARGLFTVAKCDGLHEREAALVSAFYEDAGGGGPQALAALERRTPIPVEELAAALPTEELRELFIKSALLLAWADGQVTPQEEAVITEFARGLGIEPDAIHGLGDSVKEFLLSHLTHVQNVDATRQVAQKLKV